MSLNNLPRQLFVVKTSGQNYRHPGDSSYGKSKGPYEFATGKVVEINHPQDVLYFIKKKEMFKNIGFEFFANKVPAKYEGFTQDTSMSYSNDDYDQLYAEFNEKFQETLATDEEAD